jgi:hypothetical protein
VKGVMDESIESPHGEYVERAAAATAVSAPAHTIQSKVKAASPLWS